MGVGRPSGKECSPLNTIDLYSAIVLVSGVERRKEDVRWGRPH